MQSLTSDVSPPAAQAAAPPGRRGSRKIWPSIPVVVIDRIQAQADANGFDFNDLVRLTLIQAFPPEKQTAQPE